MSKDLLLEIGMEEVPARFIDDASSQLVERVTQFLQSKRVTFGQINAYSTPRRLAVLVTQVVEQQEDLNENLKGPAKRIALDEDGNWTKAALGFARGKGANPEDLYMDEVKGEAFVFVRKFQAGEETYRILPELVNVITAMTFPKNMRWGSEELRFVRPIRWLVALYGDQVIPMTIAGVASDRISKGHRFLGDDVLLSNPSEYVTKLEEQYVIVDPEERRKRIVEQMKQLMVENNWHVPMDEGLLQEVVHLVEFPTVLHGSFNHAFLTIPREVLITTMREHQRYFPVEDTNGQLLPYFITVRNGDRRNIEGVAKGNEKVLSARLADARFFYEEDQKQSIESALARLENVVFHEELGTIGDKVRRIRELAGEWAEMLKLDEEIVEKTDRAATICKFDLVTHMVYEFPELQGIMGEDYAIKAGENPDVAKAIFEHYLPRFAGDQLPTSDVGALVSLADKIDTIVGSFAIGIIPTGSQDPYGLRRQAQGIVSILLDRNYPLTLEQLFTSAIKVLQQKQFLKRKEADLVDDLKTFFQLRLKNLLQERCIRYDVIDAVLSAKIGLLSDLVSKADVLQAQVELPEFKKVVEAFTRVNNLASKAEHDQVNPELLKESVELHLWNRTNEVKREVESAYHEGQFGKVLTALSSLQPEIEGFFDGVMVMVEDADVRRNRLGLLKQLSNHFGAFADFNKLVFP